jgi:hypothetical protein
MMSLKIPENVEAIRAAFEALTGEERGRLRAAVKADQGLWSRITNGKQQMSAKMAVMLDCATLGLLPVRLLRTDIFHGLVLKELATKDHPKIPEEVSRE